MTYKLTYKYAQKISECYFQKNFWERSTLKDGYKISTFNYFICDYKDFNNPILEDPSIKAFEMRGVTYVFNKDNSLFRRYLMIPKFFNINQNDTVQYDDVKHKEIESVTEKEDGSLVAFMQLPNGKLFTKTIGTTENELSRKAYQCLKNKEEIEYIREVISKGYTPLFEYVSLYNRIVLKYNANADLRLICLRNNDTGEIIMSPENSPFNTVKKLNFTLDELIEKSKTEENKEGWVIQFKDGTLLKIKTKWYFNLHQIRTENVFREDYIVRMYLEDKLDEIYTQLDKKYDKDAFEFIEKVKGAVDNYVNYIDEHIEKYFIDLYKNYRDWDTFAKQFNDFKHLSLLKKRTFGIREYQKSKIRMILNKNRKLKKSQIFIEKWKNLKF